MQRFQTEADGATTLVYIHDTKWDRVVLANQATDLVERAVRLLNRLEEATGGLGRDDIDAAISRVLDR